MTNENMNAGFNSNANANIKTEKPDPEVQQRLHSFGLIKQEPTTSSEISRNPELEKRFLKNEYSYVRNGIHHSYNCSQAYNAISQIQTTCSDEKNKKNIQPVKSSNEILAELFKVFNADPPEELLDDKNLVEKTKKHRKDKKRKNKRHKFDCDLSDSTRSERNGDDLFIKERHKHKRKKKIKHKEKSDSKKDKERTLKSEEKDKYKVNNPHYDRNNGCIKSCIKRDSIVGNRKSFYERLDHDEDQYSKMNNIRIKHWNNINDKYIKSDDINLERVNKKIHVKTENQSQNEINSKQIKVEDISDISLSDEEAYLKEREKDRATTSGRRKIENPQHNFYRSTNRHRYRDHSRDDYGNSKRERSKYSHDRYYHSFSRSRSRSHSSLRSNNLGIDKKRLLEIARKNAISMFKRGNLPGCDKMSQEIKDKVLLKMRYGGRTVEDLTAFCKKISNGENISDLSSEEDSDVDKQGNAKIFHHPFQLKDREPIVMNIRNSRPIVPITCKSEERTKAITLQFPVSSGQHHRLSESWVLVDPSKPVHVLPAVTQSTSTFRNVITKNILGKPLPTQEEQEPAFKPSVSSAKLPLTATISSFPKPSMSPESTPIQSTLTGPQEVLPSIDFASTPSLESTSVLNVEITNTKMPSSLSNSFGLPSTKPLINNSVNNVNNNIPDVPLPSCSDSIFYQHQNLQLDVSAIISKRLNAMRRLQENPMDFEAQKLMQSTQEEMSTWASSKYIPGQFTGSTGVNILKPNELNTGPQVWARKNQLTSAKPLVGGMGMQMLQKMGWKPGEGLGRDKNGALQPLLLDVKLDKRGLVSQDDPHVFGRKYHPPKKRNANGDLNALSIQDKHPVCLLNELTSKRKWTPPLYTVISEEGPTHNRTFHIAVTVNGQIFTPNRVCNTKKEAKLLAAKYCLQQIGILPSE